MRLSPSHTRRKGSVAPVAALLGTFLIGMIAFGIDIGYITNVQGELQHTADAVALAGADALSDGYVQYSRGGQSEESKNATLFDSMSAARARAKLYASYNSAGDVNSLTLRDEDITFGYTDKNGDFTPLSLLTSKFPNTINVVMRRDANANGAINLFFAPVWGKDKSNLTATASAALYVGSVDIPKHNVLPMALDINHWKKFLATGKDPDGNIVYADANGLPELKVYPSIQYNGNFGQLSLDGYHSGSSATSTWIAFGMSDSDRAKLASLGHLPMSQREKTQWNWIGNTGMKSSTIQTVNDHVGERFLLPLFQAKNPASGNAYEAGVGQGESYYYNIVEFVSIGIMEVSQRNKDIVIQPAAQVVADDLLVSSTIVPAGEEPFFSAIFASPRLTK